MSEHRKWREWPYWRRDEAEDLHERIRARVNQAPPASRNRVALLAIVDEHAPHIAPSPQGGYAECRSCTDQYGDAVTYPCRHVRIIADTLDVPPHDGIPPARG